MDNLFGQYRLIKTVKMNAIIRETDYDSLIAKVVPHSPMLSKIKMHTGTIRWCYKAEGRKYYIKTVPSPGFAIGGNIIFAYNDHRFNVFDRNSSSLFFRRKDMRSCQLLTSNPFYYPLEFINQSNDQRHHYVIKLWYAQSRKMETRIIAETRWEKDIPPGYSAVATVPARGTLDKHLFFYKIFFGQRVDYLPIRVEILRKGGGLIWRYDILSYTKVMIHSHPFYWMKSGRLRIYNLTLRGKVLFDDRVYVQQCILNQPLHDNDFTIDYRLANHIFTITTGKTQGREVYARGGLRPPSPVISFAHPNSAGVKIGGTKDNRNDLHRGNAPTAVPPAAISEPSASWWLVSGWMPACAVVVIACGALLFFLYKRMRRG